MTVIQKMQQDAKVPLSLYVKIVTYVPVRDAKFWSFRLSARDQSIAG